MFHDFKKSICHSILTIFGGINDNGGFNPKPLKFRDFIVLSVTEHVQIVNFKDNSVRVNINLNKQNLHSVLVWDMLIYIQLSEWVKWVCMETELKNRCN